MLSKEVKNMVSIWSKTDGIPPHPILPGGRLTDSPARKDPADVHA